MTGQEIEKLRRRLGMTQSEFAQALGLSFTTISRWETSKAEPDDKQEDQLLALKELAEKNDIDLKKLRKSIMKLGVVGIIPLAVLGGIPLVSSLAIGAAGLLGGRIIGTALASLLMTDNSDPKKQDG